MLSKFFEEIKPYAFACYFSGTITSTTQFSSISLTQILEGAKLLIVSRYLCNALVAVVVPPDPFRGMRSRRNSAETQQSGHAPSSGPKIASERLRCVTIQKELRQRLVVSSRWYSARSFEVVGRNGEGLATFPRGPTIRSPSNFAIR